MVAPSAKVVSGGRRWAYCRAPARTWGISARGRGCNWRGAFFCYLHAMAVSVFDLFKIGIGPSSSHTVGPMRAACLFVQRLQADGQLAQCSRIRAELYGSLGATGKGHGSDKAVLLGLEGEHPDTVETSMVADRLGMIRQR